MPLSYLRDDTTRRIRLAASHPLSETDAINAVNRQAAEATWLYGTLVDLRRAVLNAPALADLLEHMRALVSKHGVRGPLALVTWESGATQAMQAYANDARPLVSGVRLFQNTSDAERWLDHELARPSVAAPGSHGATLL